MGILIENAETTPELKYDHIHLDQLVITQPLSSETPDAPIYNINIKYWLYAIDSDGIKYYNKKPIYAEFNNFVSLALELYSEEQDQTLLQAISAIENALGTLIAKQGLYGKVEVI